MRRATKVGWFVTADEEWPLTQARTARGDGASVQKVFLWYLRFCDPLYSMQRSEQDLPTRRLAEHMQKLLPKPSTLYLPLLLRVTKVS